jgi:hypothetical protein
MVNSEGRRPAVQPMAPRLPVKACPVPYGEGLAKHVWECWHGHRDLDQESKFEHKFPGDKMPPKAALH